MTRLALFLSLCLFVLACGSESQSAGGGGGGAAGAAGMAGAAGATSSGGAGGQLVCPDPGVESISVQNDLGSLGGVLEIPDSCADTVVVFLSGSGSQDRDGNAYGATTDMYKALAEGLRTAAGVATLRFDDHGVKQSVSAAPPLKDFTFDLEVRDAARWVQLLRQDGRFPKVVIAGHSQGSLTGILAHQQTPIDGLVSLAGAGRPVGQLIIEQTKDKLTPDQLSQLNKAIADLEAGVLPGPLAPPLDQVLATEIQPYMITWAKWDPASELPKMKVPALVVQGTTDRQVSVEHAQTLVAAKPDAQLLMVDNMSHTLKQSTWDYFQQKAAYTDPSIPLAVGLIKGVSDFLSALP